jgi:hypothetical protein
MAIGVMVLLIAVFIIIVLTLLRFKKLKHEIFAFFLIVLILFAFFSFTMAFKGKNIAISNVSDVDSAVKIYLSWFGNAFNNVKVITTQAIKMDWGSNKTA